MRTPDRRPSTPHRRATSWLAAIALALVGAAGCAPPGIGATSPYRGEASYNLSSSNFEGRMVACTANGGPVTVGIDPNAGFDQEHPFRADITDPNGALVATRFVYQPSELLVSPPLVLGTCFAVQITSPGAVGRGPFIFTVTW